MTDPAYTPPPWSTVTLTSHSGEVVHITCTDSDASRFYGVPFSHADSRVVFSRADWNVTT